MDEDAQPLSLHDTQLPVEPLSPIEAGLYSPGTLKAREMRQERAAREAQASHANKRARSIGTSVAAAQSGGSDNGTLIMAIAVAAAVGLVGVVAMKYLARPAAAAAASV
jgi:hypothetical protein